MKNEIERKFLVKELPDLSGKEKVSYERYYLYNDDGIELRIQRKNNRFELERKKLISEVERTREKIMISRNEFDILKVLGKEAIVRDSYTLTEGENLTIKIYHGTFEGLMRAEIEFNTLEELESFTPYDWLGKEITHTPLARDSQLLNLTQSEFQALLVQP